MNEARHAPALPATFKEKEQTSLHLKLYKIQRKTKFLPLALPFVQLSELMNHLCFWSWYKSHSESTGFSTNLGFCISKATINSGLFWLKGFRNSFVNSAIKWNGQRDGCRLKWTLGKNNICLFRTEFKIHCCQIKKPWSLPFLSFKDVPLASSQNSVVSRKPFYCHKLD